MRRWVNVGFMLDQRRRRWANSKPTLAQRFMLAGNSGMKHTQLPALLFPVFHLGNPGKGK